MAHPKHDEEELKRHREQLKLVLFRGLQELYSRDYKNIEDGVSERNLCARLAHYLECIIRCHENQSLFSNYFVDVEYNRMAKGCPKKIANNQNKVVCDLLIHSRGQQEQDNLLAIEMKKFTNQVNADSDKVRLEKLTKWEDNPEFVRNTILGAFVRIKKLSCEIDFFEDGILRESKSINPYDKNNKP